MSDMIRVDAFDRPIDQLEPEHVNPGMLRSLASALRETPGAGEQASDAVRLAADEIDRLRQRVEELEGKMREILATAHDGHDGLPDHMSKALSKIEHRARQALQED